MQTLTSHLISTPAMLEIFSDQSKIQRMLDVEAALAKVQAAQGMIPLPAAERIRRLARHEQIDFKRLGAAAVSAGNLAIPLVKQLTAVVSAEDQASGGYVHWGATSQDIIDTALMLQLQRALPLLKADLQGLADALARLVQHHTHTVMAGRTWLQFALPVSFGAKVAGWLDAMLRHQDRLDELDDCLALQFGGAAGTLASLGTHGAALTTALAAELGLQETDIPWHAQRDRIAEIGSTLGLLAGSLGKMARDISLLMQTEVAEVFEPTAPGRGGSSTMPQKQNPVGCSVALSAAISIPGLVATLMSGMVQEHERALGGWQAEWETLPQIFLLCAGSLQQMRDVAQGLRVDRDRMRSNFDAALGFPMAEAVSLALAAQLGKPKAHAMVEQAVERSRQSGQPLRVTLAEDSGITAILSADDLDRLLDPAGYLGQSAAQAARVLQAHQRRKARHPRG